MYVCICMCIIIELFQVHGTTALACLIVSILIVSAFGRVDVVPHFDENSLLLCEFGIDFLPDTPYVEVGH